MKVEPWMKKLSQKDCYYITREKRQKRKRKYKRRTTEYDRYVVVGSDRIYMFGRLIRVIPRTLEWKEG